MKKKNRGVLLEILFIGALLAFVVFSFVSFQRENNQRIVEQNNSFIKAATEQSAEKLNQMIRMSQRNLDMMAHLYGSLMTQPEVDEALLEDMTARSSFDYVEFINPEGMDLAADGRTADLSDREYFQKGIQGGSGKCVIHESRITNETLLIFYTPFYYEGEIIGVLSGILRGERVYEALTTDYFDVQANSFLVDRSGNLLLSAEGDILAGNSMDNLTSGDLLTVRNRKKLERALQDGSGANFVYQGDRGTGSAYVTPLEDGEWMLVQNFPSSLTRGMVDEADSAGIRLEIRLFAVFLAYVVFLLIKNMLQKRKLVSEKQEMSQIVSAVTQLFCRFALVDFENGTYEYLENGKGGAPQRGAYADLIRYLEPKYVEDAENGERMSTVISKEYVQEHLTEDVPYLQYEYQIDMDGRRWENVSILCLNRRDGLPDNVLFAIQDVTALKEREQQIRLALKNASEAAEAANQAKTDFLARMSHDIRTPMNAIMGMTAVAAMHLDDPERLTDCLGKITTASRHLLALINDVLDMSKIESGKVTLSEEPFNMADLVESIVTIIRSQVSGRHQELKVHIADVGHEDVIGDTLRLRQVFVNILGNAVKFTPEGGTIQFSIRERESLIHGMACYEFVCEDTGIGMDKEFIDTIFDPFTRSRNSENIEGTGLGMSITRNIVRMMEGDIQVESRLGAGSKFTVQVHLKLQDQAAEDVKELADLRVLVADDDQDSCEAACDILGSVGMDAQWVLSGDEAVRLTLEAHLAGNDFAAVILDWKMPGRDGVETAREIRRQVGETVPIIILSAYDWSEVETQAREAGIQAFVEKPLFRSRLVYALKSVLAQGDREEKLGTGGMEKASYKGRRVLLVEDNELNREIARELLGMIDVSVEEAENGQQAMERLQEKPPHYYDLILMDIQMPVMNGYESARHIRALDREDARTVPIIAMTANAFADDIREALESGMNDHVAKPVEIPKLLGVLEKWL